MGAEERIFYSSDQVVVTSKRVLLKTRSLVTSAIASVTVEEGSGRGGKRKKRGPIPVETWFGGGIVVVGLLVGGAGAYSSGSEPLLAAIFGAFGAVGAIAGGYLIVAGGRGDAGARPEAGYSVKVHTVDGRKFRVSGMDPETARKIADAISAATANAE